MSAKKELSRITIDIPVADHKRLKAVAAILGKSMRDIVMDAIAEYLNKELVGAKDTQDLFKKLGI